MIWITNSVAGERRELEYPSSQIGRPKATNEYTEEELQQQGLVGIYVTEEYAIRCVINQMMIRKFYS